MSVLNEGSISATHSPVYAGGKVVNRDILDYMLTLIIRDGGVIVRAIDCPEIEVRIAKNNGTYFNTADGYGFIIRPKEWLERVELAAYQRMKPSDSGPTPENFDEY
jgi:hypothetical protein